MSDSVRPHRWQPTRLPRPWDSPGKNTGMGCHFLLQCMKVKSESEVAQSCFPLCLIFISLIDMCLGVFHLGFILFGSLWVSWTWMAISFPILGKFSAIISSSNFSWPFFSSSSRRIFKMLCWTESFFPKFFRFWSVTTLTLLLPFYLLYCLSICTYVCLAF